MMLMVAVGIDANDNVLLLLWALVSTESEQWWGWYCRFPKDCFLDMDIQGAVII